MARIKFGKRCWPATLFYVVSLVVTVCFILRVSLYGLPPVDSIDWLGLWFLITFGPGLFISNLLAHILVGTFWEPLYESLESSLPRKRDDRRASQQNPE